MGLVVCHGSLLRFGTSIKDEYADRPGVYVLVGDLAEETVYIGEADPVAPVNRSLVKYRLVIQECGGWDRLQILLEAMARVAGRHRAPVAAVATRWVLDQPGVAAAIVGMRSDRSVTVALQAVALKLDEEDRETIAAALPAAPPGDVYDLERAPGGPHAAIMRYDLNREA